MSAFTEYAAYVEHQTQVNWLGRVRDAELFSELWTTPISGDMLAVLKAGVRPEIEKRRSRVVFE